MASKNIDELLENESLKNEFKVRNLDLSQVFCPTPDNLERENRFLIHLLEWVQKYSECGDRREMEAEGYDYPPIEPGISPENDWYMFERWMKGKPIRMNIKELLYPNYVPKNPETLNDDEILSEIKKLKKMLADFRISVDYRMEIPPRLTYTHILEALDEQYEMINEGFWHLDGCTGYCPDCFQRPWCETGSQSCWPEDNKAGKMYLIDSVKKYVSPSPFSLQILQKFQAEEDKRSAEFERVQKDHDISIDPKFFDFEDEDDLPF